MMLAGYAGDLDDVNIALTSCPSVFLMMCWLVVSELYEPGRGILAYIAQRE